MKVKALVWLRGVLGQIARSGRQKSMARAASTFSQAAGRAFRSRGEIQISLARFLLLTSITQLPRLG